ncbi:amino acid permease [Thermococcus celer]|nr:amino acid permease [Thermococcus celer]
MRFVSALMSLLAIFSFTLPWFKVDGEEITFLTFLREFLLGSGGPGTLPGWMDPNSTAGTLVLVTFLAAVLMILLGALFGLTGGRAGPGMGTLGVVLFALVFRYVYGPGYRELLSVGYALAFGSFAVGLLFGGGKRL